MTTGWRMATHHPVQVNINFTQLCVEANRINKPSTNDQSAKFTDDSYSLYVCEFDFPVRFEHPHVGMYVQALS